MCATLPVVLRRPTKTKPAQHESPLTTQEPT